MPIERPRMFDHLEGERMGDRLIYLGNYLLEINSEPDVEVWMERYHNVHQYLAWLMEKDAEQRSGAYANDRSGVSPLLSRHHVRS